LAACASQPADSGPLLIQEQGSFAAGGTMTTAPGTFNPRKPMMPDGQTYHGDHAYAFYQIPVDARKLPIVMWHGAGQFSKTWETTADGREGFQNIFLRRHYGVYLIDQPRRGDAGRSMVEADAQADAGRTTVVQPVPRRPVANYFDGVQVAQDAQTREQFFRAMTPNTGPFDMGVVSDGVSARVRQNRPGILFTHSQGGGPGWLTAIKNDKVKAIVAFEPGSSFVFPEGEVPAPIPSAFDTVQGAAVPMEQFMALTRIPILILYGDNIPNRPSTCPRRTVGALA
jgi:hypothetical protein